MNTLIKILPFILAFPVRFENVISAFTTHSSFALSPPVLRRSHKPRLVTTPILRQLPLKNNRPGNLTTPVSTSLRASSVVGGVLSSRVISPTVRTVMMASVALLLLLLTRKQGLQRLLYPNSIPDSSFTEPLPPGTIGGCPYFGNIGMFRNINKVLFEKAQSVGTPLPKMFKMFGFTRPMIVLSGSSTIKKFLSHEFKKKEGVSQMTNFGNVKFMELMFGLESMSFETSDAKKYHFLQKLVGQALTPESVEKGIPALQKASEDTIQKMLAVDKVVMSDINHYLTLDVAWRQIIGLDLKNDQIQAFHDNVKLWMSSITAYMYYMLPVPEFVIKRTKAYKAKQYLQKLIEAKIDYIEKNGPDGSTLSAMVMASDDDDGKSKKLTRQQIIDNVFLLIIAGSETSSLTLTNAMLFLGMNPTVWDKLVKEQDELVTDHGPNLTKELLDNECPYLDAVVKETMRLIPVSGGGARNIDETFVMDGYQLPKDWFAMYSAYNTHEQDPKTYEEDGSHMDITRGFRPERWLNPETAPTTEFMPWGAGHRFCLGHNLASAEMRTFLAVMARKIKRFDWLGDAESLKWKEGVILTPKDGVVVSAHAR